MATKREKADNRGSIVGVRFKSDERLEIEAAASAAQVSLSDWIRDTTISAARLGNAGTLEVGDGISMAVRYLAQLLRPTESEPEAEESAVEAEGSPGVSSLNVREGAEVSTTPGISAPEEIPVHWEEITVAELPITWADQWALMERMEQGEAAERLAELAQGRKLPDGFKLWPKAKRIQWLDREWPL